MPHAKDVDPVLREKDIKKRRKQVRALDPIYIYIHIFIYSYIYIYIYMHVNI